MANSAFSKNQQVPMSPQELNADNLKKQSRRNWLRNAAIAATGAVVLPSFLTGCTKEQWNDVIKKNPGGGLGSSARQWYTLKVAYQNQNNEHVTGYVGAGADSYDGNVYWDYMNLSGGAKFTLTPTTDGWAYWELDYNNWLSLNATGWAKRVYEAKRIEWRIVDGKMYNKYWKSDWENYPLCSAYVPYLFSGFEYYLGVGLGDDKVLTNCELVPYTPGGR